MAQSHSKIFFWQLIMESRQRDTVYGYVRRNCTAQNMINDIIEIVYEYYLIRIASNILNAQEQASFLNVLWNALKQQKGNENIKSINTKLLYRASENEYSATKFHELCTDKGATITIIHNEYDHIFGGYVSKSWMKHEVDDPNAFLFFNQAKDKGVSIEIKQRRWS